MFSHFEQFSHLSPSPSKIYTIVLKLRNLGVSKSRAERFYLNSSTWIDGERGVHFEEFSHLSARLVRAPQRHQTLCSLTSV